MKRHLLLGASLAFALSGILSVASGDEPASPFPEIASEAKRIDAFAVKALADLKKLGVPTRDDVEKKFPLDEFKHFGQLVRLDAGAKLLPLGYPKLDAQLAGFEATLSEGERLPKQLPTFDVQGHVGTSATQYAFTDRFSLLAEVPSDQAEVVVITAAGPVPTTKTRALYSLKEAIQPYRKTINGNDALQVRDYAMAISAEWDKYFEGARPQTFWDITLTTLVEYKHIQTDWLVGPPPRQWFLLHPNVVVENLSAAPSGSQLGGAVAVEWVGVNWWKLKFPVGVSLASLYSDRKEVSHVGHGVMIYLANKYCIGWASHGGTNGFYVSVDALKFIDNKRTKLEGYRDKLSDILK